ncbi:putative vacuolar iron transporter Ccc1, partial [Aureobasidium melanogenum]
MSIPPFPHSQTEITQAFVQATFPELIAPLPDMSLTWVKNLWGSSETLSEKSYAQLRSSTDVESLASTQVDSPLETETHKRKTMIDARVISDAIIGLSDGLTVPFALTAGLSALGDSRVVILGGVAELIAGAISMGLGGYLGAKSEEESYRATLSSTRTQVEETPSAAACSVSTILESFELPENLVNELSFHLSKSPHLLDFLMRFEHMQPEPASSRAITCAITIALGYLIGGLVPLIPYFFVPREDVLLALYWSFGVMLSCLFVFGYSKTCFVAGWRGKEKVWQGVIGGLQMMFVGGVAAGCAMGIIRVFHNLASD